MSRYSYSMMEAGFVPGDLSAFKKEGGKIKLYDSGPSQPTNQTVTQTSIPDYAKPYVETMLGKAQALTETPYQKYNYDRIAGFTPLQQKAFQSVANLQPAQQLGTATRMAGAAGLGALGAGQNYIAQATNPYAMQAYMSPYIQGALAPQMEEARRQSAITGQQNAAQAVQAGAFGGSRFGLQEAERQRNLNTQLGNIYGTGLQNAYQNAQNALQFGSTLGLQGLGQAASAAGQLGQLGQSQFGQQKDIINALATAGGQQQALQQQKLTQDYQDFLNQQNYQKQQLSWMSDMLRGLPLNQQTQATYQAPASPLAIMSGLGTTAIGAKTAGLFANGGLTGLALYNMSKDES